ncbi:class I SAM-dependent methyltransferase [Actinacidiphila paucisporea]|uniref:RNA cap guanine-N2 methyltransferase n=1 Tax=Actinacidiphila paucisporea TaxID=310782 RepID=A0A1M6TY28_9ACTN|nr:class I SAM-dependent methyltransferase [Actinacidiphila paucisporea]SHK61794.1 RNA cap guanine-N2 methyltransferase [Actinacidiphila paucisporea]
MTPEDLEGLLTAEGQGLLAGLREHDAADDLAVATRLRRTHGADIVAAALAQTRLRQRAVAKFGPVDAHRMYFTPHGLEQSTRASVAAHRAARFASFGPAAVADLCCGVGGDVIAMLRAGLAVTAVDRDPLTCAVVSANAAALGLADRLDVRCADVLDVGTGGLDGVFVDPARRTARGRVFDPEAYSPPLSWALGAAAAGSPGAVKVAPGIPHEAVPPAAEAEWISDGGDVKEAVLWFDGRGDRVRPGGRRATLLPSGATLIGRGLPDPPVRPVGRYLYEPDGAVIRAHLVAEVAQEVGGGLIDPTIAYVTADELRPTPFATAYEVTDVLPFGLKRLKALVREREVGVLTVKKRGSAVDPEDLRRRVRPRGPHSTTVFLTRTSGAPTMLLGHPARL